ncbi:MAG: YhcN/YlaJ family sporulation lipoprotein [Xylanivirga thermophila]|uniref:YhcN/YlaJ family sporulation lipoprotein n=1 Tax=Xylanivirga thermophila TaxID=2496273 RepID=UPI0013EA4F73|nr:YhcN/YlaJ family sporulation lipoprotein [Xylanivirga thermophila]
MKRRKCNLAIVFLLIVIFVVSGCKANRRPSPQTTPNQTPKQTRVTPPTTPRVTTPKTTTPKTTPKATTDNKSYMDRANKIADKVASLKEIESSTCVITGNTAMVGVQFNKQYKGKTTDDIKDQVDKVVKNTDKKIDRVVVSADPDVVKRLEDMLTDIGKGKPISGFAKEMNELLNRIQPK